MKNFKPAFFLALAWLLFITILLCTPGSQLPKVGWSDKVWLDKWAHVFLFLVLVILWCRAYVKAGLVINIKKIFIRILILSVVYGVGMEIAQHFFIPNRSFDFGDMIADVIGSVAGYFISISRFLKNKAYK